MSEAIEAPAMEHLLADQRRAFLMDGPPSLAARRASLKALRKLIVDNRAALEDAVNADFGHRSRHETAMLELVPLIHTIDYLHRRLPKLMRADRRHVSMLFQAASARVDYQPLGVVGIMSPWNYPISLALVPLATALAAGNRAMLKPSELTPKTSALLADMLACVFPPDQVAVITGDASVGAAFSALPFDHLLFTGSTPVGKLVMRAASDNLVPVTLELGGKSPVVVAPGAATAETAASIAFGKLTNAGQTCIAPDYVLVQENDRDALVGALAKAVETLYPQGPLSADYGAIINERHFHRLQSLLADAQQHGATIRPLGIAPETASSRPRTLAPTLVLDPSDDMAILREEIFGPLLPVVTYRRMEDAIAFINARPRPLALYYFGPDGADRRAVLSRIVAGNVSINATLLHYAQDDLPFGGVGASGIGAYHGPEGFRRLSHARGTYVQHGWTLTGLLRAPFGKLADTALNLLLRKGR